MKRHLWIVLGALALGSFANNTNGQEPREDLPTGGFSAGASLYFLKPYFSSNPAFVTFTTAAPPDQTNETTRFDWDMGMAPAFWVSWTGDHCCGARAASTSNSTMRPIRWGTRFQPHRSPRGG